MCVNSVTTGGVIPSACVATVFMREMRGVTGCVCVWGWVGVGVCVCVCVGSITTGGVIPSAIEAEPAGLRAVAMEGGVGRRGAV